LVKIGDMTCQKTTTKKHEKKLSRYNAASSKILHVLSALLSIDIKSIVRKLIPLIL